MLTVITGCMFSGKSSALISKGIAHVIAGNGVIAFKPANDDRYDLDNITTHHGDKFLAYAVPVDNLWDDANEVFSKYPLGDLEINVILIDEAQFFKKSEILMSINEWNEWAHVIIAGLSQDSFGKPFGAMPELLSIADNIVCLRAVCSKCKRVNAATKTYRKINNNEQVAVGGIDMYEPRCFGCWNEI